MTKKKEIKLDKQLDENIHKAFDFMNGIIAKEEKKKK